MTYQKEIDGLRALAVLAVVIFHLNPSWLPGGFLGVDVFFVISGYLITSILMIQIEKGSFSFAIFYRNRLRRIFPVLILVVFASLTIGLFVLLPRENLNNAGYAFWGQLSLANIHFAYFNEADYFDHDGSINLFLHLWSLGVEEQFYLVWPVMVLLSMAYVQRSYILAWMIVVFLSIISFHLFHSTDDQAGYFAPWTRMGQLILGAILASLVINKSLRFSKLTANILVIASLLSLLICFFNYSADTIYPGVASLIPTSSVVLLIASLRSEGFFNSLFSSSIPRFFGLISYSLYLWHWPVIQFYKLKYEKIGLTDAAILFLIMVVLSVLSYKFVESKYRKVDINFKKAFIVFLILPAILMLMWQYYINNNDGVVFGSSELIDKLRPTAKLDYVCQHQKLSMKLVERKGCGLGHQAKVIIWGDSNAAHYVPIFKELSELYNVPVVNLSHSACPPILQNDKIYSVKKDEQSRENCKHSIQFVQKHLAGVKTIVLSADWPIYFSRSKGVKAALASQIKELKSNGFEVFVVGRIPRVKGFDPRCVRAEGWLYKQSCQVQGSAKIAWKEYIKFNENLEGMVTSVGANYFDFNSLIKNYEESDSPSMLYYDSGHLSIYGARFLGRLAVKSPHHPVHNLFRNISLD